MANNNNYKYLRTIKTLLHNLTLEDKISPQALENYSKELNGVYQMAEEHVGRMKVVTAKLRAFNAIWNVYSSKSIVRFEEEIADILERYEDELHDNTKE